MFLTESVKSANSFGSAPRSSVPAGTVKSPSTRSISTESRTECEIVGAILSYRIRSVTKWPGSANLLSTSASSSVKLREIRTLSPDSPDGDRTHGPESLRVSDHSSLGDDMIPESPISWTAEIESSTVVSEVPSLTNSNWKFAQLSALGLMSLFLAD